ncbi:MAG: SPOR domain-containing protein [Proteobacteria bacterium]|nr:SPOR domain-containing protein [Pseudomonadota bacterium]
MRSKQRPERPELLVDPKERGIFGVRETASRPGIGAERRSDGAGPEMDLRGDGGGPPRRRVLPMVVALITLAGFAGIVWYAYNWGLGQVDTARLPLILAEPEPIKSRPESPGGLEVPHQDKLVLNEVVPDPEKPQVERLLPPLETPRPPKAPSAAEVEIATGTLDEPIRSAVPPPPAPVPERSEAEAPQIPAAAPSPPPEPAPPEPVLVPPQVAAQPAAPEPAAPEPAAPEPAATAEPASPVQTGAVQTAARTPSGAYVVQLAALRARDGTRPAWARLQRAHPMLLGDRELTVQEVDLGERGIFYRVQAGFFPERAGASALCRALKARQQDCLVVKR